MYENIEYKNRIQNRSFIRFFIGGLIRKKNRIKYDIYASIARKRGATIGAGVIIERGLALKANKNLIIGDHSIIWTKEIDLRNRVIIGSNVIIGKGSEIITTSHNIDSIYFERKDYGIEIQDYVWLPRNVLVLPCCRKIGRGAVISSGSVVVHNVESMTIVSGNPATLIGKRKCVHEGLVCESLMGADFEIYNKVWKEKFIDTIEETNI